MASIPIESWAYNGSDVEYIGVYTQDFKLAFGYGDTDTDTGISSINADGVALGCIQGLYTLYQSSQQRIEELVEFKVGAEKQITSLTSKVDELTQLVQLLLQKSQSKDCWWEKL